MTTSDDPRLPLCFVLMPFGRKGAAVGGPTTDFDAVYETAIAPAVREAGLEPIRADKELVGGMIHKPMFERLVLCEYAVADLTLANANVFYELGVRHAVRPHTTALVFAEGTELPFDVRPYRGIPYRVDDPDGFRDRLSAQLRAARDAQVDSPVFQLVEGFPDIERLKTDLFRSRADYSTSRKEELARARDAGKRDEDAGRRAVRAVHDELVPLRDTETGILVDLFLSYREVRAYREMVDLVEEMPRPLAQTPLVREQYAFALNRLERRDEAERVLTALIAERGPSSETYGLLGRVYKDERDAAVAEGNAARAEGLLRKAIDTYVAGFEADWRDAYPGLNAVTLMTELHEPDPRQERLLPVVAYAVERRLATPEADYWDHATAMELAVLAGDEARARRALADALSVLRAGWEATSTARTLRRLRDDGERRGTPRPPWVGELERALLAAAD